MTNVDIPSLAFLRRQYLIGFGRDAGDTAEFEERKCDRDAESDNSTRCIHLFLSWTTLWAHERLRKHIAVKRRIEWKTDGMDLNSYDCNTEVKKTA